MSASSVVSEPPKRNPTVADIDPRPIQKLPLPQTVVRGSIRWHYVVGFVVLHAASLLACMPWFFSWSGVALCALGYYVFGVLGINLCYHRLLTHRGFECPLWLEHLLTFFGVCCLQDSPARWVAIHRLHHQHSDEQPDPHSPLVAFLWGHIGWLLVENKELNKLDTYDRYARDVLRDPFNLRFDRNSMWMWTYGAHALAFYLVGLAIGWAVSGNAAAGLQLGASWLVWGVVLRTVLVWHATWSVNSFTHLWGYRNYETGENSRNNFLVAIVSNGEGWHNNHHFDQRSARHGHRWWEFDTTWLSIRALQAVGLARNVVLPKAGTMQ